MANQNPTGTATAVLTNATPNEIYTIYESTLLQVMNLRYYKGSMILTMIF
jgi:hypothetical protein